MRPIGTAFANNTEIKSFNEFQYFTNITKLESRAFEYCKSLKQLILPKSITNLSTVYVFYYCPVDLSIDLPNLSGTVGDGCFTASGVVHVLDLGSIDTLYNAFRVCEKLLDVVLPSTLTHLGTQVFDGSSSLNWVILYAVTPPTLENVRAFNNTNNCPIYIPDESVNTYKSATNWSSLASRIKPLSEFLKG